jgi:hypothetical protein
MWAKHLEHFRDMHEASANICGHRQQFGLS